MEKLKKMQSKFKIEFNRDLKVFHYATFCENREISSMNLFKNSTCYFNFSQDRVEFSFEVERIKWNKITFITKTISYETFDTMTLKKSVSALQIGDDKSERDSDYMKQKIYGDFKNILLNLFSQHSKEFKLAIEFLLDENVYKEVFTVKIPNINQEDWNPKTSKTGLYLPETIEFNYLVKLYKNGIKLGLNSSREECTLRDELIEYQNASTVERFGNFNFLRFFKRMLTFEDLFNIKQMEDYSLSLQKVSRFRSCRYSVRSTIENHLKIIMCQTKMKNFLSHTFVIEMTRKMSCDMEEFDHIYLTDMSDYQQFHDDLHEISEHRIMGKIHYIFGNFILFQTVYKSRKELREKHHLTVDEDRLYHVEFYPNRIAIRVAHRAVDDAINNQLLNYFINFDGPADKKDVKETKNSKKFKWINEAIRENKEQQTAVKNIFNCSSFPAPYVIFGPPGTGKSTTIIEAIAQIIKLKPLTHILVTASSNATCDDIANRLLKFVSINKILRLYSPSFDKKPDKIDKNLEPISNFRDRHICDCNKRSCPEIEFCDDPSYEEFYTCRVIIATLVSCGRIVSAGVKSNHFDYIFIDEAASECEQYTLIPITGLGSTNKGISAQIVLSGDHKQLGAIVRDNFCQKLGMEKSLMERLMETNSKYKRDPRYNQQFVTQLVKNYRSHPAILEFSNKHFYDSKLIAVCPPEVYFACNWDFLLHNKEFPVLFHTSQTPSKEVGYSLKNEGEIQLLDNYISVILNFGINGNKVDQSDIGVISPYRAQRDRIIEELQADFPRVEIGTIDAFQGREKKIILVSTVRSKTKHVGFLRNEKRLNVALTRAKSLLIIIGNSATLQRCQIWNKFIAYCYKNRCVVGDALSLNKVTAQDANFKGDEEIPNECEEEYK